MHFQDLTPYEYYLPFKLSNVLNVGWLDQHCYFQKRPASQALLEKLTKILLSEGHFEARVNQIRGVHSCNLCEAHTFHSPFIGSCELWLPNAQATGYFAGPSLLIHYISEHDYSPPEDFVEAVLQLDLNGNFNGQQVYDDMMRANATATLKVSPSGSQI